MTNENNGKPHFWTVYDHAPKPTKTPSFRELLKSRDSHLIPDYFGNLSGFRIDAIQICAILTHVVNATALNAKDRQMKVSNKDFAVAKAAAKKVGLGDHSAQHAAAIAALKVRCPQLSDELIGDLAWEAVKAARP